MATIKRGILGGFSGKVGNVVGSSWKGVSVMKSMPLSVANPRTTAQVANRTRFSALTLILSAILGSIVKPLNDRFAAGMSGINRLAKLNKDAIDASNLCPTPDFKISEGKMLAPQGLTLTQNGSNNVITWNTSTANDPYASADDEVYIYVTSSNDSTSPVATVSGTVTRSAGTATAVCAIAGQAIAFVAFRRADGTVVSDTGVVEGV